MRRYLVGAMIVVLAIALLSSCSITSKLHKQEQFTGKVVVSIFSDKDTIYYVDNIILRYDVTSFATGLSLFYNSKDQNLDIWIDRLDTHTYYAQDDKYVYVITFPSKKERKQGILLCIQRMNTKYDDLHTIILAGKQYKI